MALDRLHQVDFGFKCVVDPRQCVPCGSVSITRIGLLEGTGVPGRTGSKLTEQSLKMRLRPSCFFRDLSDLGSILGASQKDASRLYDSVKIVHQDFIKVISMLHLLCMSV